MPSLTRGQVYSFQLLLCKSVAGFTYKIRYVASTWAQKRTPSQIIPLLLCAYCCYGNVLAEPCPSNGLLIWLHSSPFQCVRYIEKDLEISSLGLIKILYGHLPGRSDDSHGNRIASADHCVLYCVCIPQLVWEQCSKVQPPLPVRQVEN
jgi:hypothetical protein